MVNKHYRFYALPLETVINAGVHALMNAHRSDKIPGFETPVSPSVGIPLGAVNVPRKNDQNEYLPLLDGMKVRDYLSSGHIIIDLNGKYYAPKELEKKLKRWDI